MRAENQEECNNNPQSFPFPDGEEAISHFVSPREYPTFGPVAFCHHIASGHAWQG